MEQELTTYYPHLTKYFPKDSLPEHPYDPHKLRNYTLKFDEEEIDSRSSRILRKQDFPKVKA